MNFICKECNSDQYTKEKLRRHLFLSRCGEKSHARAQVSLKDPVDKQYDTESSIDVFMNRLSAPTLTSFKKLMNGKDIQTSYRKHTDSYNIKGSDGKAEYTWKYNQCDMISKLYICLPWSDYGTICLSYGNSIILEMEFEELYQIGRQDNNSSYVDMLKLLLFSTTSLPICCADLKLEIYYNKKEFQFGCVAEMENISKDERNKLIYCAHEIVLYQYDKIRHAVDIMEYIETRFPISAIYNIYEKTQKNDISFNIQELIDVVKSPIYAFKPSETNNELKMFHYQLDTKMNNSSVQWNYLLPKGRYPIMGSSTTLIVKYVAILALQDTETYINKGLISKPAKEAVYDNMTNKYKGDNVYSFTYNNIIEQFDKEQGRLVYDKKNDTQFDSEGNYWEGRWFKPIPTDKNFPIPEPTDKPVDPEFLEALIGLLPQLVKSNMFCMHAKCKFTDKKIENMDGFDTNSEYWFKHDNVKYMFYGTLIHDYKVLCIQPSEQFYKAVMKRSKYQHIEHECDWFKNIGKDHNINIYRPIGLNTIGSSMGQKNIDIRDAPFKFVVSPWLQSTIEPNLNNKDKKINFDEVD
jgi:hypothetical protein